MKISVIVPTYNRPKALKLCLLSLASQSIMPYDILIADDGSTAETRDTVLEMQEKLKHVFPVKHVWHEDIGFRKPKILNETVRQSTADYLIFIDGDCMAHRHFIRSHVENSSPDAILSGKRVEIGKELTKRLIDSGTILNSFNLRLLWDAAMSRSRKVEEAIIIRNRYLRHITHRDRITNDGVWGCNFSLYKDLFMAINGCDEDFLDGSIEDNDLGIRVLNQGKQIRSVRGLAIIFHLWHESSWSFEND
ncbi:MAG TPA: glycosyltransferase family 2 protein, partial [Nitrospirota bacterium]|nr:glycosyltransferase family 2 protein [Nitrospirota bacterium]